MSSIRFVSILLLFWSSNAFQFMSKWKVAKPADLEAQERVKEKFGDKSK